jgi:hypothetical protein
MVIQAKVITGSTESEIEKISDSDYKVRLKSRPVRGQANFELSKLLSDYFSVPKSNIRIKSGFRSNLKIIEIKA